jgi:CubicO group peptidase (beta-lactamase class C family)
MKAYGPRTALRPSRAHLSGFLAPGFEPVREEFARNFTDRGELGAAFAATLDGEPIVDLWGGVADEASGRQWCEDTVQLVFSGTKGLVALCLLILMDRGILEPEEAVADYWPEFAAAGKDAVQVREVASHQARLPGVRAPLAPDDVLDAKRMAALLAAQPQESDPRAKDVYHPLTFGWLCAELIRRIDGRDLGRFFAEEVARPLDLELWIGLPEELEARVSTLRYADGWGRRLFDEERLANDELYARVWANPPLFQPGEPPWNSRPFHAAGIPGAGAIGTARSMARLYGCLARGGVIDDVRLLSPQALARGRVCLTRRREAFTDEPEAFGIGFALQTETLVFGPPVDAFGHGGAGGSAHGAWPTERVGFSYCMNELRDDREVDPRAQALLDALHQAVVRHG